MGKQKHQPIRTCVVCHAERPKRELIRIVRTKDGVRIDPTGKLAGRGAYICPKPDCWRLDVAVPKLQRALKTMLTAEEKEMLAEFAETLLAPSDTVQD